MKLDDVPRSLRFSVCLVVSAPIWWFLDVRLDAATAANYEAFFKDLALRRAFYFWQTLSGCATGLMLSGVLLLGFWPWSKTTKVVRFGVYAGLAFAAFALIVGIILHSAEP